MNNSELTLSSYQIQHYLMYKTKSSKTSSADEIRETTAVSIDVNLNFFPGLAVQVAVTVAAGATVGVAIEVAVCVAVGVTVRVAVVCH